MVQKPIVFMGDSLDKVRTFPAPVRRAIGYQLDRVQRGLEANDFKALPTVGKGVEEIRVKAATGAYRVIYIARLEQAIYVLHAFKKKTRRIPRSEVEVTKARLTELQRAK